MPTNWLAWCYRLITVKSIDIVMHWSTMLYFMYLGAFTDMLPVMMAVFFFVTLHELAHALVAARCNIGTDKIYLIPIGGVAAISGLQRATPREEFFIAGAGPLSSLMMAFVSILVKAFAPSLDSITNPMIVINLMVGIFNLIPVFPMDGGRMLRSFLAFFMDYCLASLIAVRIGQCIAFILGILALRFNYTSLFIIMMLCFSHGFNELEWLQNNRPR